MDLFARETRSSNCSKIRAWPLQSQAILSLVSAGLGLAVVPSSAANVSFGNIVFRKIRLRRLDDKLLRADLVAAWKPETRNDARAFLLDIVKSMPPG